MALTYLLIAVAGLLQCWLSNMLRILTNREMNCIRDTAMMLETQYFNFFCGNALPAAVLQGQVHAGVMLLILFLEIMAYLH